MEMGHEDFWADFLVEQCIDRLVDANRCLVHLGLDVAERPWHPYGRAAGRLTEAASAAALCLEVARGLRDARCPGAPESRELGWDVVNRWLTGGGALYNVLTGVALVPDVTARSGCAVARWVAVQRIPPAEAAAWCSRTFRPVREMDLPALPGPSGGAGIAAVRRAVTALPEHAAEAGRGVLPAVVGRQSFPELCAAAAEVRGWVDGDDPEAVAAAVARAM